VREAEEAARQGGLGNRLLGRLRARPGAVGGRSWPAVLILALASAGGPAPASAVQVVDEAVLKATYLYKFAQFVEWPDPPPAEASLCIAGSREFIRHVEQTLRAKSLAGRPVVVRRVDGPEEAAACRLFFVAQASRQRVDRWLEAVGTRPILTIGEQQGFAARGGMINLTREGKKLRFEINQAAVERAGLRVSSQLMKIARPVADAGRWD